MNVLGKSEATELTLDDVVYVITGVNATPLDQKAKLGTVATLMKAQDGIGNLYTNASPMPATVGGLPAGTTFSGKKVQDMWDALLYPYQVPAFSAFSFSQTNPIEVGDTIASGNKVFSWTTTNPTNVNANSISILDVTGSSTLATGLADDGSQTIAISSVSKSTAVGHTWRVTGINSQSTTFTRDFTVNWRFANWYGETTQTSMDSTKVKALRVKTLGTGFAGTYTFTTGGYKWLCFPSTYGTPAHFKDAATQLDVAMNTVQVVSVANVFSVAQNYNCYRTLNILGGAIQIIVS